MSLLWTPKELKKTPPHRRVRQGITHRPFQPKNLRLWQKKQDFLSQIFLGERQMEVFVCPGSTWHLPLCHPSSTFWTSGSTSSLGHSSSAQECGGPRSASWWTLLCKDSNRVRVGLCLTWGCRGYLEGVLAEPPALVPRRAGSCHLQLGPSSPCAVPQKLDEGQK